MKRLTFDDFVAALRALGVAAGDIVHVQSDLRRIGPVEAEMTVEGLCGFYLEALQTAVGADGTVTCCTAFEDAGRYATPYLLEESPSRTDTFSEFLRLRPGAVRSLHPIMSVTALGRRAEEICGGNHYDGFGCDSPWGRLHRANAHIMTPGMGSNLGGTTFFHYVEQHHGVPYVYCKLLDAPVFADGKEVPGPFTVSVRYLDFGIAYTNVRVKDRLLQDGIARQAATGRAQTWSARAQDVVDGMCRYLGENRWIMLQEPPNFRHGEIPWDGTTGEVQRAVDAGAAKDAE